MHRALVNRVRRAWAALAEVPVESFSPGAVRVLVSPASRICPIGWVGVVGIEGSALATAASAGDAERVRDALASVPDAEAVPEMLAQRLAAVEVLGPASLYYAHSGNIRLACSDDAVESVPADDADLARLLGCVDNDEADESALASITSRAFVVRVGGVVVSAAGYRRWPSDIAHLCVLTAPSLRGRGLATRTAGAAAVDAIRRGLLPQWRGRPAASRRVAEHLAFDELGWQLSLKLSGEP